MLKKRFFFIVIAVLFALVTIYADEQKKNSENPYPLDAELSAEAKKKFPANQWVIGKPQINIPEQWKKGNYLFINSYASITYCGSLNTAIFFDGYTYSAPGKEKHNNYADSVYTFDPMKNEIELFKRSNWFAGRRTKTDLDRTSYPFDENKTEPTPCPRHTYRGFTWDMETNHLYLINGANAGIPNEHPKYKENNATTVETFWRLNLETRKWEQLKRADVKRLDTFETILTSVPGTGKLYYFDDWNVLHYDIGKNEWKSLLGNGPSAVQSHHTNSAMVVDYKRQRIVFFGGNSWRPNSKGEPARMKPNQLHVYDIQKNEFSVLEGTGDIQFEKAYKSAGLYLTDLDQYLFATDNSFYLFDPTNNQWKKTNLEVPKLIDSWFYLTYDTKRGLILMNNKTNWGVLRFEESK